MEELYTYDTVLIPVSDGKEQEFAILEEFDLEEQHYIVVSPVVNDEIQDGCYVYQAEETEDGLDIAQIEDEEEFARVCTYVENRE